ncbi:MAG: arginine repressor [Actinomycetota bacterium]
MAAELSGAGGRSDKQVRQRRIIQLLRTREVESQAELAKLLARAGDSVTQATLSRDLEDIGAFKGRSAAGRVVYRIGDEPSASPAASSDWMQRMLREFATEIDSSGNVCVIKTPPGGANAVARAIDNAALREVIGTIAGDDTIMCVVREGSTAKALARKLRAAAGHLNGSGRGER